jgi:hypothetical protein
VVKAQSDITATKANAVATLPKQTLISTCEANQGFKFSPITADLMMKMSLETLNYAIIPFYQIWIKEFYP